ncbi:hypothetical protein [Xanthomonas vasicola]|nr:hypothetical protein [Xanthomonas vasicola]
MGGPVPVPVVEAGAYAGADAACVNARPAIQPPGGKTHASVLLVIMSVDAAYIT